MSQGRNRKVHPFKRGLIAATASVAAVCAAVSVMAPVSAAPAAGPVGSSSTGEIPGAPEAAVPPGDQDPFGHRSWLRPGCQWDGAQFWVQRCVVYSPAMQTDITVQVQPARQAGNAGLYLLDGLRARDDFNAWTNDANAVQTFLMDNITLVMPVGGEVSFYSDWRGPAVVRGVPHNYKWETFLTTELPGYLYTHFGVSPSNNAVTGLSMGASAALTLAAHHPDQFHQVSAFSGYLNPSAPGMFSMIALAMFDQCKCDPIQMWGLPGNDTWSYNDPLVQADKLRETNMYISAASGIPGVYDTPDSLQKVFNTFNALVLEGLSRGSTVAFQETLNEEDNEATFNYPGQGTHSWPWWNDELTKSRPQMLEEMNAFAW